MACRAAMGWAVAVACGVWLGSTDASALLIEKADDPEDRLGLKYYYPYPTIYDYVDERYAFDDDPLEAFTHEPYFKPVVVTRVPVRRSMVQPRMSFVDEMYRSTESM